MTFSSLRRRSPSRRPFFKGRRAVAALLVVGLPLGSAALVASTAEAKQKTGVPADIQRYAATSGVDPYNADPSSLHVSVTSGTATTVSYVHVDFTNLGRKAKVSRTGLNFTITSQSSAPKTAIYQTYNVNLESAILQACVLTEPLTDDFDPATPPAYDCGLGSATAKVLPDGTWDFELAALLKYWHDNGNTGLALVPVIADPQATWAVSFLTTSTVGTAVYKLPGSGQGAEDDPSPSPSPAPAAGSGGNGGNTGSLPPLSSSGGGNLPAPVDDPVPAGSGAPPDGAAGPGTTPPVAAPPVTQPAPAAADDGPLPLMLVLGVGLGLVLLAIAIAHRGSLTTKFLVPLKEGFRAHPAPYALAATALAWTMVFSVYTVTRDEPQADPLAQAPAAGTQTLPDGSVVSTVGDGLTIPATGTGTTGTAGTTGTTGSTGSVVPGTSGGTTPGQPVQPAQQSTEGTVKDIGGVDVFFPKGGGVPVANLFDEAHDRIGISSNQITLCAHAATTYGDAFNITPDDLNVYWEDVNARGGINGRKVVVTYENDNYDPGTAVQAAQACADKGAAALLGGIGWDQTPAVRQWAEQNRQLYFHNSAVQRGSAGLHYSFSFGAPVEQFGHWFAQIVKRAYPGKKVAILWRQSPNWQPARDVFLDDAKKLGISVVADYPVQINQGNYTQELLQARNAGAEAVFALENSLSAIEIVKQAQAQNWHPGWALVGANIVTNTLGDTALDQPMVGTSLLDYYTPGYYGGGYAAVSKYIREFEALYAKRDPGADLGGPGGDILYSNWESQRVMADLLETCGQDCTRNKLAGILLAGYHREIKPLCELDFSGGDHHWGYARSQMVQAFRAPNGRIGWQVLQRCKTSF